MQVGSDLNDFSWDLFWPQFFFRTLHSHGKCKGGSAHTEASEMRDNVGRIFKMVQSLDHFETLVGLFWVLLGKKTQKKYQVLEQGCKEHDMGHQEKPHLRTSFPSNSLILICFLITLRSKPSGAPGAVSMRITTSFSSGQCTDTSSLGPDLQSSSWV